MCKREEPVACCAGGARKDAAGGDCGDRERGGAGQHPAGAQGHPHRVAGLTHLVPALQNSGQAAAGVSILSARAGPTRCTCQHFPICSITSCGEDMS